MSKTKEQIEAEISSIRTETVAKSITASRLGGVLQDMLDSIPEGAVVPTKVSELENDADYAKRSELPSTSGLLSETKAAKTYQPKGNYLTEQSLSGYAKKTDLPKVPTKTSDLINDSEYATQDDLEDKVNKEEGMGLTSNDYTDADKRKLADIESKAQKNVQADWNETNSGKDSYIRNKPDMSLKQDKLKAGQNIEISDTEISALPFDKVVKYASDDAARKTLGGDWRIPTAEEWNELMQFCVWTRATSGDADGWRVTGSNGNSIYIPCVESELDHWYSDYWTSRRLQVDTVYAACASLTTRRAPVVSQSNAVLLARYEAARIRPVSSTAGVDLGLPSGLRWAGSNLAEFGLEDDEAGSGGEYAWAETEPKTSFSWSNYKFNPSGDGLTMTKYNMTDKLIHIEVVSDEYTESKEYEDLVVKKDLAGLVQLLLGKQDKITEGNKLPYSLLSGTPTKLSQLTNDTGFATVGLVGDLLYSNHSSGWEYQLMAEISLLPWQTAAAVFTIASKNTGTGTVSFHLQTSYQASVYTVNLVYHGTPTVMEGCGIKVYRNADNNKLYIWLIQNDYSPCFVRIQNTVNVNFSVPSSYYPSIPSGYTLVKSMDII